MSHRIVKRPQATLGIWETADYIAQDDLAQAEAFVEAVDQTLTFLADFPESGDKVPTRKQHLQGLRLWQVKGFPNHLILYRLVQGDVEVLAVFHGARHLPAVLRELS